MSDDEVYWCALCRGYAPHRSDQHQTPLDDVRNELRDLRQALAFEAEVIRAQTAITAVKGSRRKYLDDVVRRIECHALGLHPDYSNHRIKDSLKRLQRRVSPSASPNPKGTQ